MGKATRPAYVDGKPAQQQPIHVAPEHAERVREGLAWLRAREARRDLRDVRAWDPHEEQTR